MGQDQAAWEPPSHLPTDVVSAKKWRPSAKSGRIAKHPVGKMHVVRTRAFSPVTLLHTLSALVGHENKDYILNILLKLIDYQRKC